MTNLEKRRGQKNRTQIHSNSVFISITDGAMGGSLRRNFGHWPVRASYQELNQPQDVLWVPRDKQQLQIQNSICSSCSSGCGGSKVQPPEMGKTKSFESLEPSHPVAASDCSCPCSRTSHHPQQQPVYMSMESSTYGGVVSIPVNQPICRAASNANRNPQTVSHSASKLLPISS